MEWENRFGTFSQISSPTPSWINLIIKHEFEKVKIILGNSVILMVKSKKRKQTIKH